MSTTLSAGESSSPWRSASQAGSRSSNANGFLSKQEFDHKYSEISGNQNMFKSQLTDLNKRIRKIPQVEQDIRLDQTTKELHQLRAALAAVKVELGQTAKHASLQQLKADVAQIKTDLGQTATHHSLQQMFAEFAQVKTELGKTAKHGSIQQLYAEMEQVKADLGQSANHESIQQLYSNVHKTQSTLTKLQNDMKDFINTKTQMTSLVTEMKQEANKAKTLSQEMSNAHRQMDQKATQMKNTVDAELKRAGKEIQGTSQKMSKQERELAEMRQLMRLPSEFATLKQTLNDSGVLKPPKVEAAPDQPRPVGTIGLAEDCFSSRLLINIGFLKARAERHRAKTQENFDARTLLRQDYVSDNDEGSTDEDEDSAILRGCEMVQGISAPDIEEGASGYMTVTLGMLCIVIITLMFQLMIVLVLVYYGLAPSECYDNPPTAEQWWILHGSKAAAIIIAGLLMGKDFMDIVNYSMVTMLIEPKVDVEMVVVCILRFSLTVLIGLANLFMFEGMVSPFSVWINMAALVFVGELGAAVNDQIAKGVFGHDLRSTVTGLNYQLTFVSVYPWWIKYVQCGTIMFVAAFIMCSAMVVVMHGDPMCPI